MFFRFILKFLLSLFFVILLNTKSFSEIISDSGSFLSANQIEYHEELSMISAIGDVEVINANEILRARELTYDFKSDIILAKGKVSLKTKEGDILYADTMELKGNLKSGVIKNFSSILNDGSRLSASKIIRDIENGDRLEKVIYTKCEICEDSPDEFPIWQLRALKSKRNVEEGRIEYNHVILDAYGFPLFYFPAISHSDPSIKKSSGFLSPKFKNNSVLGPTFTQPYYYVLSESSDITFMPTMTYNEGPILGANYRKLGSKSSTFISGSFTKGSMQKTQGEEEDSSKLRGHININSVERISKKWIAGINFIRATDSTYLPRYRLENIGSSGTLTQRVHFSGYEEGFFSEIEGLYFQPMDASKSNRHVPLIFPNTKTLWTNVDQEGFAREIALNTTSIARASGSNSQRISLESKWTKERILDSGHIITTQISGRTDLYRDRKTDLSQTSGDPGSNKNIRLVPKLETTWRLPSKGDLLNKTILLAPIVQGIISPNGGTPNSIINNDSMDIEISHANLFSDKFAGLDRIESGPRINFGFKTNLDLDFYGKIYSLIGRSWRPKPQIDFTKGTGLSEKLSDLVGNLRYNIKESFNLDYSFRRDSLNLRSQRDTLSLGLNIYPFSSNLSYTMVREDPNPSPTAPSSSEQALASLNLAITDNWSTNIRQSRDFIGSNFGDAIYSRASIGYVDECIHVVLSAERQHRDAVDVPDATTYSVTFHLVGF